MGRGPGRKSSHIQGEKEPNGVPGLPDAEEGVIYLQEELPGDVVQAQQVLFKQNPLEPAHACPSLPSASTPSLLFA